MVFHGGECPQFSSLLSCVFVSHNLPGGWFQTEKNGMDTHTHRHMHTGFFVS